MNIQIKSRFTAAVLFEHDCENNSIHLTVEMAIKNGANLSGADLSGANLSRADLRGADLSGANLSCAYLSRADLRGADLSGANLSGANLSCAYLSRADLRGADLRGADLSGANLSGANLSGASLSGAYLSGAYLSDADLRGASLSGAYLSRADLSGASLSGAYLKNNEKLIGARPILQIGPIGSRCAYFVAYITDQGLRFDTGCQRQIARDVFEARLANQHGENDHAKEYRAALALIDAHAAIWTPKEEAPAVEPEASEAEA